MTMRQLDGHRNRNLDMLRAIAIVMVVVYHAARAMPSIRPVTNYGEYGVDLFFVLSGWLVGGLYWRERLSFGNVQIIGFWIRRWMRTLPPYFAALLVSWLAVRALRNEPFDYGYLLFVQNYYRHIPFFLISWSLCVEEHFYLLAPLMLLVWQRGKKINSLWFFALFLLSPLFRFETYGDDYTLYWNTATHLRMDGLILGLWLSYLAIEEPRCFQFVARLSPYGAAAGALLLIGLVLAGGQLEYTLWGTMLALFFSAAMICLVSRDQIGAGLARLVVPIAVASYSVYLTHAWAIYAGQKLVDRLPQALSAIYFPVSFLLVAAVGAGFYFAIERPSIKIRDAYWPRRTTQKGEQPLRETVPAIGRMIVASGATARPESE